MTPWEYLMLYRDMAVSLIDGRVIFGIDVHEYRNATDYYQGTDRISDDHDVDAGMDIACRQLCREIRRRGSRIAAGSYRLLLSPTEGAAPVEDYVRLRDMQRVFNGKGKPEDIRLALRLAAAFGQVAPTSAAMNDYCTQYVGLDCSGFVGNFLQACGSTSFGPNTPARSFAPASRRIGSLSDIRDNDVLCWKNTGHVAIIDLVEGSCDAGPGFSNDVTCWVAESCGSQNVASDIHSDGLNYTLYTLVSVSRDKVFQVRRGLGTSRGHSEVYIARLI